MKQFCLEVSHAYEKKFKDFWGRLGLSVDWSLLYSTIDKRAQKISQYSFLDLYKKGRIYQKKAPILWCPECETAIAQVELRDEEKESTFVDIIFKLENKKNLVIATTRPELLPSCVAVFVHPQDRRYKQLVGKKAQVPLFGHWVPIMADSKVNMEKGTSAVMSCTFGDITDAEWYLTYNLPLRIAFTKDGKMTELAKEYQGMKIKEARKKIIVDLKEKKLLVKEDPLKHMVNVHERCGVEIEILETKQWFLKYLDLKEKFL
ncbi:class I tRNA ligase family protein [Candidatus Woesearchaeota archaeon]|nr:class I tRNA ligase family protein [Candidatus Woesearchaeota archaeon]